MKCSSKTFNSTYSRLLSDLSWSVLNLDINGLLIDSSFLFRDMAQIVDRQGESIQEISKATDNSHQRAKAGLDQVKQAAAYQPTCSIS